MALRIANAGAKPPSGPGKTPDRYPGGVDPLNLPGVWTLTRDIQDRRAADQLIAEGIATFTPLPDGRIHWHEAGTLRRSGTALPFTRTMFLVPSSDAVDGADAVDTTWDVTFEDGRAFHPWPRPSSVSDGSDVVHVCTPDLYRGHFVASTELPDAAWGLVWNVTGPHKDYTMTSTYSSRTH